MKLLKTGVVGGLVLAVFLTAFGASATPLSNMTTSDMYTIPRVGEPAHIDGAYARLRTNEEGAMVWIRTSGFLEGNAISVWWVVFNHPEHCIDGCNGEDLFHNGEATGASMIGSPGLVVSDSSDVRFFNVIEVGSDKGVEIGPGLINPMGAEIHMVLRDHGPARNDILMEQISTYMGGCDPEPPHHPCWDSQFSIHQQ